jgi:hypothetical protein
MSARMRTDSWNISEIGRTGVADAESAKTDRSDGAIRGGEVASMTHAEKVDGFLQEMRGHGVNPGTAAPPAWRALWRLGLRVPPPHFMGFVPLALVTGVFFGVLWGLAMAFLIWGPWGGSSPPVRRSRPACYSASRWRPTIGFPRRSSG